MTIEYISDIDKILSIYVGSTVSSYTVAFLILAVSGVLAKIVNFVFSKILFRLAVRNSSEEENHVVAMLNAPMFYSVVLFGLYQSLSYIKFLGNSSLLFEQILKSIAIFIWASSLSQIARIVLSELSGRMSKKSRVGPREEMFPLFKNIASLVVWFTAIAATLQVWNMNITPLLASAGIAGFAVAFAAQDTISHLFGGLSIYFDKPFRVGDRIQLDSGEIGDVLEIGVRSTRIKTLDETVVIIPNKIVASSRIVNYNKPKSKIKLKISLSLGKGTNIKKAKKAILDIIDTVEGVEKEPLPSVYFTELGETGMKFLVVAWVANPKKQFEVKTLLVETLYEKMTKDKFSVSHLV